MENKVKRGPARVDYTLLPCANCKSMAQKKYRKNKLGELRALNLCEYCYDLKAIKSNCTKCGFPKTPNTFSYCQSCSREQSNNSFLPRVITIECIMKVKGFVEYMIRHEYNVGLMGLNDIITHFFLVCKSENDYSPLNAGKQLQNMWNYILDFYNKYIQDKDIDELKRLRIYRKSTGGSDRIVDLTNEPLNLPIESVNNCKKCLLEKPISEFPVFMYGVPGKICLDCLTLK